MPRDNHVISCPCALVISVPLTFFGGIGGAGKRGILVKGSNYMETLSRCGTVLFDKTGTLTHGRFSIKAIYAEPDASEETLLYGPEIKFYSNKVKMDEKFNTNIEGLHCLGDSSGWTRGLMMASVMGVLMGRELI